jgi:type II secretory pathway component PulC
VLAGRQFVGFRLAGARHLAEWRAAGLDLREGDVVVRVNGVRIVRPEHAMTAFERMRTLRELVLEVLRDGAPLSLRHPILDAAPVAARTQPGPS